MDKYEYKGDITQKIIALNSDTLYFEYHGRMHLCD